MPTRGYAMLVAMCVLAYAILHEWTHRDRK